MFRCVEYNINAPVGVVGRSDFAEQLSSSPWIHVFVGISGLLEFFLGLFI